MSFVQHQHQKIIITHQKGLIHVSEHLMRKLSCCILRSPLGWEDGSVGKVITIQAQDLNLDSPYLYKSQAWWYICNPRTSRKGRDRQTPELTRPGIDSWPPHICVYACTHAQTHTQRGKEREGRGKKGALSTLSHMYKFLDWNYWARRMITVILRENLICMERMAIFITMF